MTNDTDPEDDGPEMPGDLESTASAVYSKMLVTRTLAVLAAFAALGLLLVADDGLLAAAAVELALHGAWAVCALVCAFGLYEAARLTRAIRRWNKDRRERRAVLAGMTPGEQESEFIDTVASLRGRTLAWWMESPRSRPFWRGAVTRLAFAGCAAVALGFWLPPWSAALGAFGVSGAVIGMEAFTRIVFRSAADLVVFIDPRSPRNTPEI